MKIWRLKRQWSGIQIARYEIGAVRNSYLTLMQADNHRSPMVADYPCGFCEFLELATSKIETEEYVEFL